MIISIASGKGGTGKTTVSLNLAFSIFEKVNLLDVDVEEPNCHIFIPGLQYTEEPVYSYIPEVNQDKCILCEKCSSVCQFNAIATLPEKVIIFEELCHSCGGCSLFCPKKAIKEVKIEIGKVYKSQINNLSFLYGALKVGYPMSPPVIKAVKKYINPSIINILDCPPGISCPTIESVKNTDFCVLVSDPTPFGIHDLKLTVSALRYLNIAMGVVINRCDIGDDSLLNFCSDEKIPVLAEIPDDRRIAEVYSSGKLIIQRLPEYKELFQKLYCSIKEQIL